VYGDPSEPIILHRVATNYCLGVSGRRAIVGVERCLASIFDERHFVFERMEEFVFIPVRGAGSTSCLAAGA
jgi:hypothetical protein